MSASKELCRQREPISDDGRLKKMGLNWIQKAMKHKWKKAGAAISILMALAAAALGQTPRTDIHGYSVPGVCGASGLRPDNVQRQQRAGKAAKENV
jgi:hypothetical protein